MAAVAEVAETAGVAAVVTEGEGVEEVQPVLETATASSVEKRATSAGSVLREVQTNASTAKRRDTCRGNARNPELIVAEVEAEGEVETEDVAEVVLVVGEET